MAILMVATTWAQNANQASSNSSSENQSKLPVGFQMNIDVEGNLAFVKGFDYQSPAAYIHADSYTAGGVGAILGLGARMGRFLYVGVAAGAQGEWGKTEIKGATAVSDVKSMVTQTSAWICPIYADIRLFLPTRGNCYPFAEVGLGGYCGLDGVLKYSNEVTNGGEWKNIPKGDFYMIAGAGLEFKRLTVGLGYKLLKQKDISNNVVNHDELYLRLGVSLGRNVKIKR